MNKQYWTFKFIQLMLTGIVGILTIIFIALPYFEFNVQDGIEVMALFAGISYLSNGVKKSKK